MTTGETTAALGSLFLGQFEYAIDTQRRIAIPKQWRQDDSAANLFFVVPGRDQTLQIIPGPMFSEFLDKIRRVSFADAKASYGLAVLGSLAAECRCDGQGRICLTPQLMEHAGLGDRAVLIGAVMTIQVWSPSAWRKHSHDSERALDVLQAIHDQPDDFTKIVRQAVRT